jgi:hypothetical protein
MMTIVARRSRFDYNLAAQKVVYPTFQNKAPFKFLRPEGL